jgi:hypothetical protein
MPGPGITVTIELEVMAEVGLMCRVRRIFLIAKEINWVNNGNGIVVMIQTSGIDMHMGVGEYHSNHTTKEYEVELEADRLPHSVGTLPLLGRRPGKAGDDRRYQARHHVATLFKETRAHPTLHIDRS